MTNTSEHALPDGYSLTYFVHHEAWYAHVPGAPRTEPHLVVCGGSADDSGAWEFRVSEHGINGGTVKVSVFADAFAAFRQIPEFFAALATQSPRTLSAVCALLDSLGARDITARTERGAR